MTIDELIIEVFSRGWNLADQHADRDDYELALKELLSEIESKKNGRYFIIDVCNNRMKALFNLKLDLDTLKQVKLTFDIHSDHSTRCNGYHSLCRMIEESEKINQKDKTE